VSDDPSTVPVIASDLRVGDVIKGSDGHYYAVDTRPEPSPERQEYPVPHLVVSVTEMNGDRTHVVGGGQRLIFPQDADLTVLAPRPGN
jgi:hypothetical protein